MVETDDTSTVVVLLVVVVDVVVFAIFVRQTCSGRRWRSIFSSEPSISKRSVFARNQRSLASFASVLPCHATDLYRYDARVLELSHECITGIRSHGSGTCGLDVPSRHYQPQYLLVFGREIGHVPSEHAASW